MNDSIITVHKWDAGKYRNTNAAIAAFFANEMESGGCGVMKSLGLKFTVTA
jgi:DNA-binding phage protein